MISDRRQMKPEIVFGYARCLEGGVVDSVSDQKAGLGGLVGVLGGICRWEHDALPSWGDATGAFN